MDTEYIAEELAEAGSMVGLHFDGGGHIMCDSMNPKDRDARAQGKAPLHYLEPAAEEQIARAMQSGAEKYGYRNYTIEPVRLTVYISAMLRHVNALRNGEDEDPDSGLSPLAHIGANVHVLLAAAAAGKLVDDRAGEVLQRPEPKPEPEWIPMPDVPLVEFFSEGDEVKLTNEFPEWKRVNLNIYPGRIGIIRNFRNGDYGHIGGDETIGVQFSGHHDSIVWVRYQDIASTR